MCHSDGTHRRVIRKNVDGSSMDRFVINVKDGGRCHKVAGTAMGLPLPLRPAVCGWRFGSAVSLAASRSVKWGSLCRKCFPNVVVDDVALSPIEEDD